MNKTSSDNEALDNDKGLLIQQCKTIAGKAERYKEMSS